MVDFKQMQERWYAGLDDEARARVDARRALEAKWRTTEAEVTALFERLEWKKEAPKPLPAFGRRPGQMFRAPEPRGAAPRPGARAEPVVAASWEAPLTLRIEDAETADGRPYEFLRFVGGPTGYEAYELTEEFCARLIDAEELRLRPRFYICAGTPGSWHACSVAPALIEGYLRERRPHLFPETASTPAGPA